MYKSNISNKALKGYSSGRWAQLNQTYSLIEKNLIKLNLAQLNLNTKTAGIILCSVDKIFQIVLAIKTLFERFKVIYIVI